MFLLHDDKTNEWTRRQAAWRLNWVKYKSGDDALHGTITTAWHKKSHRQFPASQRQKWIRSEPRYIHTHAHTLWSSIVGYHFVCSSTNVVYCQLLGELNIRPVLFLESSKTWLHSPTPSSLGLFNKNMYKHIMVQKSKSTRFQTDCRLVLCFCALFSGPKPGIPRATIMSLTDQFDHLLHFIWTRSL